MSRENQKLKAIIVDWAGTIIDHGSRAPVAAFQEVFRRRDVEITPAEARGPMGKAKRDHIVALLAMPRVSAAWQSAHGRMATDADVDALYDSFLPIQTELLAQHADVIPGVLPALAECRRRGLKIGSSSGYAAPLMEALVSLAADNGLHVDAVVSASEVPQGRPAPWMVFKNLEQLDTYPPASAITIDDTTVGIEAGLNAGTWTIGVVETGNQFGLGATELMQLEPAERAHRFEAGRIELLAAGAHYAIASVGEIVPVLDDIERRLAAGERP